MIEWIAFGVLVVLIAIGLIGNRLRVRKLQKEGKPDTQMAEIDMKAREKLKGIKPSQTIKASRLYIIINKVLPFGNKEKIVMEETKQEAQPEPELYVAAPKPPKQPPKPRGQWMKQWWAYKRSAGSSISLKEFIAKKKEGSL